MIACHHSTIGYTEPVPEQVGIGIGVPEIRRIYRATINAVFVCALHGLSYGRAVCGGPSGSPVPNPGTPTHHGLPSIPIGVGLAGFLPRLGASHV